MPRSVRCPRAVAAGGRVSVQRLERRCLLDAAFHPLSSGSLFQDWENPDLLTIDLDWSLVPSIEGFALRRTTGGVSVDPRTILDDAGRVVSLTADETDRLINTSGVVEYALASPIGSSGSNTVAMQADEVDDEAYLSLRVSNAGRGVPVRIRYDLIDIDPSAATPTVNPVRQSFVLQYRLGTTGAFANVPGGYVENAADYAAGAVGRTTTIDATLPADTAGASQVELRIMTTNGGGLDQLVAVDNIRVFGNDPPGGVIEFMPLIYQVHEDVGTIQLSLRRIGSTAGQVSVRYTLQNGTASGGSDFVGGSGVVTFLNGQATATASVTILNDSLAEPKEWFRAVLDAPTGGAGLGSATTATIFIDDNDLSVPAIRLNEIKIQPPDRDSGAEYIEISGTSNAPLSAVYFVTISGEPTLAGQVMLSVPLEAFRTGTLGGLTMIAAPGTMVPVGTTLIADGAFAGEDGALPSLRSTFALIFSTTPITPETDLDPDDNGTLDLPPGAVVIDSISIKRDGIAGLPYGPLLDNGARRVDAATRRAGVNTLNSVDAWYFGELLDPTTGPDDSATGVYDPRLGAASSSLPPGAILTPGSANYQTGTGAGQLVILPKSVTVSEGSAGTVEIYRAGGAVGAASLRIRSVAGTAQSGADFVPLNTVVSFAAGEFVRSVSLSTVDDTLTEAAEWFDLVVDQPTGASLLKPDTRARLTIRPSDGPAPSFLILSEWNNNPPGLDPPYEFIELRGTPGETLYEVYIALIEGSGNGAGKVDQFIDLSGATIGSDGYLLVKATNGGFEPASANAGVFGSAIFDAPIGPGIESDTNTILLLHATPGAVVPALGTDLDPGNTGTLALDPRFTQLDSVAWLDGDEGVNLVYSPAVLPALAPFESLDAGVRFRDDLRPHNASSWYFGKLTGSTPDSREFGSLRSFNFPEGGRLTPGRINDPPPDQIPPTLVSATWQYWIAPQLLVLEFSENVGPSLEAQPNLQLRQMEGRLDISYELTVDPGGRRVELRFSDTSNPFNSQVLDDGNYELLIPASSIYDLFDNTLEADVQVPFRFLSGDINNDGTLDFQDLLLFAQNWGILDPTYLQGDLNFDGMSDFADLLILAQRFGFTLNSILQGPAALDWLAEDRMSEMILSDPEPFQ